MLRDGTVYKDFGADHFHRSPGNRRQSFVQTWERSLVLIAANLRKGNPKVSILIKLKRAILKRTTYVNTD
jgi:hypothetical protein